MSFQIGANMDQNIQIHIESATAQSLGLRGEQGIEETLSLSNAESSNRALGTIDSALKQINSQRANLGAYQNRAEMASKGIAIAAENLTASESVIRDANMAETVVEYTKQMILNQSSLAMLANANQNGEMILNLLK
jgi:flagellin